MRSISSFLVSEDLYRDGHKVGFNGAICPAVRTHTDGAHAPGRPQHTSW
jgi:hypothetical protein